MYDVRNGLIKHITKRTKLCHEFYEITSTGKCFSSVKKFVSGSKKGQMYMKITSHSTAPPNIYVIEDILHNKKVSDVDP